MNIHKLVRILIEAGIEENEAKREIKMLLEHFCSYTEKDSLLGREISSDQIEVLEKKVLLRAQTRIPIQHIIGQAWFMGEYFKVTPDVLIPRDETEILVRKAIEISNNTVPVQILDQMGVNKSKEFLSKMNIKLDKQDLNLSMALGLTLFHFSKDEFKGKEVLREDV